MEQNLEQTGEIVMYQPDETIRLEVRMSDETVWLTTSQMAELFGREESNIRRHVINVFKEKELDRENNVHILHVNGVKRPVPFYTLDVIISVGYRVKSLKGTDFRRWATKVLKDHLLQGYSLNCKYHIGASIKDLGKKWFAFTRMHDIKASELISKMN